MKKLINKEGSYVSNSVFENVRVKVNQNSRFESCKFVNCTFIGRTKHKAMFNNCLYI